jgi:aspartate 1-decarboxylase
MQTRTYGELFKLIRSLAGVGSFSTSELDDIANLINRRFLQIFNESPIWPRYFVPSEKRDILALTLSGATESTDTTVNQNYKLLGSNTTGGSNVYQGATTTTVIIYNTGTAWRVDTAASVAEQASGTFTVTGGTQQFIEADTNKKDNITEVETFTPRAGTDSLLVEGKNLVPFAQTGKTTIGSFNRVFRKQPFLNQSATEYEFFLDVTGANILNIVSTTDNAAFVSYKKEFTPFDVTSGYDTSTVEVPNEFFPYLAHATYADFLRMDGQTDKAFAEEERANLAMALELEKVDIISNNNTVNKRFSTYVNRQSR